MKHLKISLVLCTLCMLICCCLPHNAYAAQATEEIARRNSDAVEFLQSVEAIEGDWGNMELTSSVTRSDAAQYFAVLLREKRGLAEPAANPAEDVKLNKDYATAVYNVMLQNIIPATDGKFNPNAYFTYGDMKYALCRMLGYTDYAETLNLGERQLDKMVSDAGIFKNVKYGENLPMTKADFAVILKNALTVRMMPIDINGGSYYSYDKKSDITMLEEYLSVQIFRGVIKANKYTTLTETEGLGSDDVMLEDMKCAVGKTDAADYIGCNVEAYVKVDEDNDINTILRIDYRKCNVLVLDGEALETDVSDFSIRNIVYKNEKGKRKSVKISADADFFYNNRVCVPDVADFSINNGTVTLVSNDDSNIYDVVKIAAYENYVVDYVDTKNSIVYDKIKDAQGNPRTLDLSEDDKIICEIKRTNGRKMSVGDLKKGNVLSVYRSKDGGYVDGVASTDTLSGIITAVEFSDVRTIIGIDGEEYKFFLRGNDWGYNSDLYPIMGMGGAFYLDTNGFIAYAEYTPSVYQYGFVTRAVMDENGETATVLLTDEDGGQRTLTVPQKGIRINDYPDQTIQKTLPEGVCAIFAGNSQLVQFIARADGTIVKMNIAQPLTNGELYDTERFVLSVDLGESECTYSYAGQGFWKKTGGSAIPAAITGGITKVFVIDGVENSMLAKNENIHVYDASDINKQVTVKGVKYYDVDSSLTAKAMVYVLSDTATTDVGLIGNACIFDKITEYWEEEESEAYRIISVYRGGRQESYRLSENASVPKLEKGDIVAMYQDFFKDIQTVYNINNKIGSGNACALHGSTAYNSSAFFGRSYLSGVGETRIAIFDSDAKKALPLVLSSPTIYEITRENGCVDVNTKASLSSVQETQTAQDSSVIYYYAREGKVYDIIIYK